MFQLNYSKLSHLIIAAAMMVPCAYADEGNHDGNHDGHPGHGHHHGKKDCGKDTDCNHKPTPARSWEEFLESCRNPEAFQHQVPPSNIKLQCYGIQTRFVQASPGSLPLPGTQTITYSVFSDKSHVEERTVTLPIYDKGGTCSYYEQVQEKTLIEIPLNCAQALALKTGPAEYCAASLGNGKAKAGKLVDRQKTGEVIDTCRGSGGHREPIKPRDPHHGNPHHDDNKPVPAPVAPTV